ECRGWPLTAVRVTRLGEAQSLPHAGVEPEGPDPERGVRERHGPEDGEDIEVEDRDREGELEQPALRYAEHHHPWGGNPDGGGPCEGAKPPGSGRRRERGAHGGPEGGGSRPAEGICEARPAYSADFVIPMSRARAYGANVGAYTSPHHWTWSAFLLRPSTDFHTLMMLSVSRMSFHVPTTSPFLIRKIPSRGIVEKSPVT